MNGIKTQQITEDRSPNYPTHTAFKVQINGKWFEVQCTESDVLDGRYACSSNVHKWDCIGTAYEFKIKESEAPEQKLPSEVEEFITRFLETGTDHGLLMRKHIKDQNVEYPGHEWGWVEKRFKDDYVA